MKKKGGSKKSSSSSSSIMAAVAPTEKAASVSKPKLTKKSQRKFARKLASSTRKSASKLGQKIIKSKKQRFEDDVDGDKNKKENDAGSVPEPEFELIPEEWRNIIDPQTGESLVLSDDKISLIQRLVNLEVILGDGDKLDDESLLESIMYQRFEDFFTQHPQREPISSHKRRTPLPYSKYERAKIIHLAKLIRRGVCFKKNLKKEEQLTDTWDSEYVEAYKRPEFIAAPKMKLPSHEESYRPSEEYLLNDQEKDARRQQDLDAFIPQQFNNLRSVPGYARFMQERFARCLDLYLCARQKRNKLYIDPDSLLPKLPSLEELRPFPDTSSTRYVDGHPIDEEISFLSVHASGKWMASSSKSAVCMWEVTNGRLVWQVSAMSSSEGLQQQQQQHFGCISFSPNSSNNEVVLAFAMESKIIICTPLSSSSFSLSNSDDGIYEGSNNWKRFSGQGQIGNLTVKGLQYVINCIDDSNQSISNMSWHRKGDYLVSVKRDCTLGSHSVAIHQLSRGISQYPFRKISHPIAAVFSPTSPLLFVSTRLGIRVYDLKERRLTKKLLLNSSASLLNVGAIMHPSGDHVVTGTSDGKVLWYDLDLSVSPFKALQAHSQSVCSVAIHSTLPLFASASNENSSSIQLWHQRVEDLLMNPVIVPITKLATGNDTETTAAAAATSSLAFHPQQPWLFVGHQRGGSITLYV